MPDGDLCRADEFPPPHLTPVGQHVYGSWTGTAYPSHVHKFKGIVVGREPCPAPGDPCPEEATVVYDYLGVRGYTVRIHWCPVHAVAMWQAIEHE